MRNSISRKVTLGIGVIVFGATVAMFVTYFGSTFTTKAIHESQEMNQALNEGIKGMEVNVVSGGLQLFKYMETNDDYYRQAFRRHHDLFLQHSTRFQSLAYLDEWKNAAKEVTGYQEELNNLGANLMSRRDQQDADIASLYTSLGSLSHAINTEVIGNDAGGRKAAVATTLKSRLGETVMWLGDFLFSGKNRDKITGKLTEVDASFDTLSNLPLSAREQKSLADLKQALLAFKAVSTRVMNASEETRNQLQRVMSLQQQIATTISTRITPSLMRYSEESRSKTDTHQIKMLLVAGGMAFFLSLLAVLAGRYVRRSIVEPIEQLAKGADAISSGNLEHRVRIKSDDEFSSLADTFNHMVDHLQTTTVSKSILEEKESQMRALLDGVRDYAIFSIDEQGFVTGWNAASTRILGYEADEIRGVSFSRIFKDKQSARITRDEGLLAIASTGRFEQDTRLLRQNGEEFDANVVVTPLNTGEENITGYSVVVRDITERLKAERHIEQLATRDTLTGLPNRAMLIDQMNSAIARAARATHQLVVMFIDLDHFKAVNDTLGHAAGDELLREVAKRLSECVREVDIVARLGGDEFVVLLTDVTDTGTVTPVAERMLKTLTTPYRLHGHDAQTSASIGICIYPNDGNDVTTLMKNADIAMYHAKEQQRNNYQYFAPEMNERVMRRLKLERELRSAVQNNEFVLYYQPQVVVATGEIKGAEALIRWQHPTEGLLSPTTFISIAEETGLIIPIGEWILDEACRVIKAWRSKGIGIPYVVANVSAAQLGDDLVASVRRALVKHDIEPNWLMLEITETMLMQRVEEAISILNRIRGLGIRIAMDDFGTGYSSLGVLQRLPLDTLKIDRSFVVAIDDEVNNERAVAIIGAIIAIAKELNLSVVAEGVESTTQLAFLRTLNCDTYQGYLYSKPIDEATLELQFAAPAKSVLEDEDGRALTMTTKVTMELSDAIN